MKRSPGGGGKHDIYLRFIDEYKSKWGPFAGFLTKFHLKYMEIVDFLEDDNHEGMSTFQFLVKYFHMILKSSSMHGTHHISQVRRHPCEVILWCLLVATAVTCSIGVTLLFWSRYNERPTVMAIERDYMNWNVSFPPLTICGTKKINKTALYDYVSASNVTNKRKLANFVRKLVHLTYDTVGEVAEYPGIPGEDYLRIVERVTYNMEADMVTSLNESYPLQRIMTEMGICYAFNWNIARYFSPEYFLEGRLPPKTPEYTVSMFDTEKFAFLRNVPYSWEFYTNDLLDIPNTRRKLKVPVDTTTFTLLRFNAIPIVSCDCIRELRVKQRMCRYLDESNLRHFPIYTFSLCRIQCKIDAILESCGCIPFFYKRLPGERYCNWQGLRCVGRSNGNEASREGVSSMSTESDVDEIVSMESSQEPFSPPTTPDNLNATNGPPVGQRKRSLMLEQQQKKFFATAADFIEQNHSQEDEFAIAGKRYAANLRNKTEEQRLITEKLLADVVFHGRLGMLKVSAKVTPSVSTTVPLLEQQPVQNQAPVEMALNNQMVVCLQEQHPERQGSSQPVEYPIYIVSLSDYISFTHKN